MTVDLPGSQGCAVPCFRTRCEHIHVRSSSTLAQATLSSGSRSHLACLVRSESKVPHILGYLPGLTAVVSEKVSCMIHPTLALALALALPVPLKMLRNEARLSEMAKDGHFTEAQRRKRCAEG